MDNNGYTLSDFAAVTNGNGLLGGGSGSLILILLFFLIVGNGGMWGNRGDFGQYATAASQQEILFGQQFQNLDNKMDRLGNGIADATFAINNSVKDGNSVVAGRVVDEGRAIQMQLANCCCENQKSTDQVRYDMANFAAAINSNIDNKFAALEKAQLQAQIDAQAAQISQLYMAQQMAGVVKYPMSSTWSMAGNPFCGCNNGGGCCC